MVSGGRNLIKEPRRPRLKLAVSGLTLSLALGLGLGLGWVRFQLFQPYRGYDTSESLILIPRGSTGSTIGRLLQSRGIIRSQPLFSAYVSFHYPTSLKAGEYLFSQPMSLVDVADRLYQGETHQYRVTVPEGETMKEVLGRFAERGFGQRARLWKAGRRTDLVSDLDPLADNLEGYLFPDTYYVTQAMDEDQIVQTMVHTFRSKWTAERRARAEELRMTTREVITLASLIEEEARLAEERPLVSAVFHNRLDKKVKLACDPTVIYAVQLVKEYDGIIHRSDLQLDSPYNTYLYPGLPPGPIANPGLASIDAALYPAPVEYLYFVSRNDGSHVFSTHYRDHSRAVRRYQR